MPCGGLLPLFLIVDLISHPYSSRCDGGGHPVPVSYVTAPHRGVPLKAMPALLAPRRCNGRDAAIADGGDTAREGWP